MSAQGAGRSPNLYYNEGLSSLLKLSMSAVVGPMQKTYLRFTLRVYRFTDMLCFSFWMDGLTFMFIYLQNMWPNKVKNKYLQPKPLFPLFFF